MTGKEKRRLLERFPEPEELFEISRECLDEVLPEKQARLLWGKLREASRQGAASKADGEITGMAFMREQYERLGKQGISFVAYGQEEYPVRLREIPDPPLGIYYKGRLPGMEACVAIIGSRDCSEYGKTVAATLGTYLGERGIPVISGMARGIDGISQQATLEAGGESYGILGCGVDVCYPKSNERLYETLTHRGGILSEYPPGTPPASYHFPPRNRIVSGLSMAVVVVEAAIKSGTSITVSMALEQGRDVFVVPGRITDRLSGGCNSLLKQGAGVYLDPESFLEEIQESYFLQCVTPSPKPKVRETELSKELEVIWNCLEHSPKTAEELQKCMKDPLPIQEITVRVMELVLAGKAKQVSSGHFCRR